MAVSFHIGALVCVLVTLWLGTNGRSIDELIVDAATSSHTFDLYQANDTSILVELDIKYTKEQWEEIQRLRAEEESGISKRKAVGASYLRWTNRIVPYSISSAFSSYDRQQLDYSFSEYHKYTCLQFKPRSNERNYISIVDGGGCSSYVGMIGNAQAVTLGRGCRVKSVIVHELGHAIGFHHEQTRPDRDSYVTINTNNIQSGMAFNFQKYSTSTINSQGVAYDYSSIMHYGAYAFSTNNRPTITTKDPYWQNRIGTGTGLSFPDIRLANIIYNCGGNCGGKTCPSGGYLDKNCKCMCKGSPVQECVDGGGDGGGDGGDGDGDGGDGGGGGGGGDCENYNRDCDYWASLGHCTNGYQDYMTQNCPAACRLCCANYDKDCEYWASLGHCTNGYENWMTYNCPAACKRC